MEKSIKEINEKPLIQYSIEAAQESKKLTDCIVSTDGEDIFEFSKFRTSSKTWPKRSENDPRTSPNQSRSRLICFDAFVCFRFSKKMSC